MSHAVSYVVDIVGVDFNAGCPAWQRAPNETIEVLRSTGSRWDGDLQSIGISFTAELTGLVTIIWLTKSYTAFLTNQATAQVVLNWEKAAFSWLSAPVARVDEFVLNRWESLFGELWFTDPSLCAKFWIWIREQDPLHWELLANANERAQET
jgi:hypothetical protein